jgi:hypothetical protein
MVRISLLALFAAICLGFPAKGAEDRAATALSRDLKEHAPSEWDVRVRWRDGQLLATITPQPYQTAFELWYAPAKMLAALKDLCPGADAEIWSLVGSEHDIFLEASVGGKTVPSARVSCRKTKLDRS